MKLRPGHTNLQEILQGMTTTQSRKEKQFLEQKVAGAKQDLKHKGDALREFQVANQAYSVDAETSEMVVTRERLAAQENALKAEISAATLDVGISRKKLPVSADNINFLSRVERDKEFISLRNKIVTIQSEKPEPGSVSAAYYNDQLKKLNGLMALRLAVLGRHIFLKP